MKPNKKNQAFIFDIDGTIADNSHRQSWVKSKPKNWAAYNATMDKDTLIVPTAKVFTALRSANFNILVFTGREDTKKELTLQWLHDNNVYPDEIYMRKEKDYRDDAIVKSEMLDKVTDKYHIIGVFDDRPKVVRMWRERGLFVFNVLQNDEEF